MKHGKRRHAFTLVELLVVLGIIVVLIGMLLPSMSRARAKSNSVVCQSNLRQVGMAMLIYADEHGGFLFPDKMGWDAAHVIPPTPQTFSNQISVPFPSTGWTVNTWPTAVMGTWNPPIMLCPSDQDPVGQHSYLINEHMASWNVKFSSKLPAGKSSSEVVLMGEKATTVGDYYMELGDFANGKVEQHRHGIQFGSNYLMLDLHVDTKLPNEAENALDPWDFGNGAPPPAGQATGGS